MNERQRVDLGTSPLEHPLLALAREVGREAAELVRTRRPDGRVEAAATKSTHTDVVTAIDRASEELIRDRLLTARPDDSFVGEEFDDVSGSGDVEWVVDPIDGTVNFMYGLPAYAVAIAARVRGVVEIGYVINIATAEEWGAVRGGGAWRLDGAEPRRVVAPTPPPLSHLLVATGFGYDAAVRATQGAAVTRLLPQIRDIRRLGAAALDLCNVAEGRVDAFVEQGLKPWDLAAGGLVAAEAGIELAGLDGPPDERLVMAAHRDIAGEYFALIRACGF